MHKDLKNIENLFTVKTSNYDSKKKLNRSDKVVPTQLLEQIENGITLEGLNDISKKFPIFKYSTQITIHGQFANLENNYTYGYKNIFQNKNKSIGIKYTAIDECKRQRMAERLYTIGIRYHRSSTETYFYMQSQLTSESVDKFKNIYNLVNANKNLFYGNCEVYAGSLFGLKFITFKLQINAIPEKNIETFLNALNATPDKLAEYNAKKEAERAERDAAWEQSKLESEAKRMAQKNSHEAELKELKENYQAVKTTDRAGLYILPKYNYQDELKFVAFKAYFKSNRARKLSVAEKSFDTLQEALQYNPEPHYNHEKKAIVKGYFIKE